MNHKLITFENSPMSLKVWIINGFDEITQVLKDQFLLGCSSDGKDEVFVGIDSG